MAKPDNENSRQNFGMWLKSHAKIGIISGMVVLLAILLAVWVAHPRVSGTYYGYIDGKKNVKIVIEKDGQNKKLGYLQYVSTTDTGRAIKQLTKALDRNNQVISELADKDSTALEAKNLMNSKLYKDYLTEAKIPMQAVKHKGKWYLQYQSALFKEAGYSQSDIKDFTKDLYGNGTYSKENELAPGWRKMTVGTGEKYFFFYRGSKELNKPQDWAAKTEQKKLAKELNESADVLNKLADLLNMVDSLNDIGKLLDTMDDVDNSDNPFDEGTATDDSSTDSADSGLDDVSFVPSLAQQRLVFE